MKNKFISKKKKRKLNKLFFISMLLIGLVISYKTLEKSKIKIKDKDFIDIITNSTFTSNNSLLNKVIDKSLELTNPIKRLNMEYSKYISEEEKPVLKKDHNPTIYLYNTHQTEEYQSSSYAEFSVNPTVMMNDYILEDVFNKNGYYTYVEESSIKEILNKNKWNYSNSYKASRILLEERIKEYPNLKYFIDIHRDSLKKDKTTITIDNKNYAKILFIVGLENDNYNKNLAFTEKIHNKCKELYPNLSKGIYKKSGPGVNGIYNQDFNEYTILVEIGGYENNTTEVLNSTLAFSKCFMEVINEENN